MNESSQTGKGLLPARLFAQPCPAKIGSSAENVRVTRNY
eukprot:COSAG02_NODE_61925_length_267_cov_0.619048_1_plen_38_part_10